MATFGEELRRERELRGIDLREIAEATKVNLRFLDALERNEFDTLPGGLFTRGFIRAYASHIGADPDKLVNAYLFELSQHEERARQAAGRRVAMPRVETATGEREVGSPAPARTGALLWILVAGAALAATVGYWARQRQDSARFTPAQQQDAVPSVGATDPLGREAPAERSPVPDRAWPPAGADGMLAIEATEPTWIRVFCGPELRLERALEPASRVEVGCDAGIRVDAGDGGALRFWLGGAALDPAAAPGVPLKGWRPGLARPPA